MYNSEDTYNIPSSSSLTRKENKPAAYSNDGNCNVIKSNTIETPQITLPKGGGAIKGIDEKFSVNTINGTSNT